LGKWLLEACVKHILLMCCAVVLGIAAAVSARQCAAALQTFQPDQEELSHNTIDAAML
jgi:hypothetical protein